MTSTALSDDFPVLLGPVRVETRFTPTELLVRVFPDDWAIDTFEPKPSPAEVSAVDAYWIATWRAGADPAARQAAFDELTARVPAGRAAWLVRTRVPANPADQPTTVPAGATVLVVVTAQPVPAADRAPTVTYWTAVWRAHGDRRRIRAADTALQASVGGARAATIRGRRPAGLDAAAVDPSDSVLVAFLVLPAPPAGAVAGQSWTQAARARLLPDRFTVLGYVGGQQVLSATGAPVPQTLTVSPDPAAADQLSVNEQTGALHVPDDLRWLTDFTRAVQVGMGLRIPLTDQLRGGLDRLVVLGLRQQSTPAQSAADLADLITRQVRSPAGYRLLPQVTPTNNTEQAPAGADTTVGPAAGGASATPAGASATPAGAAGAGSGTPAAPADWLTRTDGHWLADLLGVDPAILTGMPNAGQTDQRDARAANLALWPATWGSYLETALHPLLDEADVEQTRQFFTRYVSGRGALPAVQIGRQPYGLLPTTAFGRLAWPDQQAHRRRLRQLLDAAVADWRHAAATSVARLPRPGDPAPGDPHQILLDILALHPTSVEFYQRYARSVEEVYNRENLAGLGPTVLPALDQLHLPQPIRALLARLGHPSGDDPDLIRRLFAETQHPLLGPLVDDRPLSESAAVRPYTTDGRNYLRWLADLADTDLDAVRLETGFADDRPPAALLYLLLRHAVLLGWADTARRLAVAAGSPDVPSPADPPFVHVATATGTESRFGKLYSPDPAVTGDPHRLVVDAIPAALAQGRPGVAALAEQVQGLDALADLATGKLERVLVEHLDCATYRLDAWRLGLAHERLAELRYGVNGGAGKPRGLHLGAYGWLEDVRPRTSTLTPVQLSGALAQLFTPPGSTPLLHDPDNGGFVHAPSPGQATTAAVLRAGYLANATPDNPGSFAVDLSSDRVRVALTILDGIRQGQSLGAMLGYRFERGLHDRFAQAELDAIIGALRGAFPLRAGRLSTPEPGTPAELIEARTVIDGLELVRRVTRTDDTRYPFGAPGLPPATPAQLDAIDAEVQRLLQIHDAVADLAVAESTHQAVSGNPERATTTLDAFAKEGFPPDPAIIHTPRTGVTLTHRFGLQLKPGLNPGGGPPRSRAEPAVDDWLRGILPDDGDVVALVTWTDPVTGAARSRQVAQRDLGLAPIDLLWALRPTGEADRSDLDDRIVGAVLAHDPPRPDSVLTIEYTRPVDQKVTFFQLSPLVAALRTLLTTARPLRPTDLVPAAGTADVDRSADDAVTVRRERPAAVRASLAALRDQVADYVHDLTQAVPDARVEAIDVFLRRYADLAIAAGGFGMVRSGWGELVTWRRAVFTDLLAAVAATADRMAGNLADADALIAQEAALPPGTPDEQRFALLQTAERLLRTAPTSPRPAQPAQLRAIVKNARTAFSHRLGDLRDLAGTHRDTLAGLLDDVAALLPLTAFDPVGLDLGPFRDRVLTFAADLLTRAGALVADATARLAAADAALAEYDQALTGPDRVTAALDALRALLGEDALAVPEFTAGDQLAADLRTARANSDDLLKHLSQTNGRDFPVDDWLHGVARVREAPRLWERVTLLSDALRGRGGPPFTLVDLTLEPIQLPVKANDHWLGLEFAAGAEITEDRLLFTAHYADKDPPPPVKQRCGLLLDEWTEVIPNKRETTGIALDVDRPDSEPPQAMLLVVPPVRTGSWLVEDIVAAVNDTYDLAQLRAVEPQHLDDSAYAHLLPATILAAPAQPITIGTDLALGNLRWKTQ
ncbi:hypothetical protein ACFFWC_20250 [Plantactinospora siamensis]|uniref:Uncharacterized protein n=1 Tax=Plantactinospora siamensis TaxID=555372 RepID=A0ABV6P507_9ACTN